MEKKHNKESLAQHLNSVTIDEREWHGSIVEALTDREQFDDCMVRLAVGDCQIDARLLVDHKKFL